MGPIDFAVIAVVLIIVGLALFYVIRAKMRGAKCIGCPSDCSCSGACASKKGACGTSCSCGCGGCGAASNSSEERGEKPEA